MGLFDKLRAELIDIVEWVDDSQHTLVWRFPRYQNEIKNGAQLIVRPGQMAVFVHRGELADVFEPGHYELKTDNLPLLSTLAGWKYGFNSPFKAEVYFVSTKQITDLKWGTPNPIMLRDPEFGPIRIRAFGTYALKAIDARALLREVVGTDSNVTAEEITELVRSMINSSFADMLGESKLAALDMASKYTEIGDDLRKTVCERIDDEYGLEVTQMVVVNISLPEAVEKALDTRTSIGVLGDMNKFQQYQMGQAMTMAAENPGGGGAAEGMGLGMGFAMAGRMMQPGMFGAPAAGGAPGAAAAGGPAPPPLPGGAWHVAVNGQTMGPYTMQQMSAGAASGELTPDAVVWTAGMQGWVPANNVPQLTSLFSAPPPPPPGATPPPPPA